MDTVYTASPVHTYCLWHLAHAHRAYSASGALRTPYIYTPSACSTFPPHIYVWYLPCTHTHTLHVPAAQGPLQTQMPPPIHGSHTQLHAGSQPRTLTPAHTRHPIQHPPGWQSPGSRRSLALPILPRGGRRGQGCRGRDQPGKRTFQHITLAASNAEGRCPPCPSSAPATPSVGSPRSLGTRRHAEMPGQACCPFCPHAGRATEQNPAPQDFKPRDALH